LGKNLPNRPEGGVHEKGRDVVKKKVGQKGGILQPKKKVHEWTTSDRLPVRRKMLVVNTRTRK